MESRIEEVTIIDNKDDFSDHKTVLLKLNFCIRNLTILRIVNNKSANWSNDAIKCYYARTGEQLCNLTVNDCYADGMCCDSSHCDIIDTFCDDIISVLRSTVWHDNEGSKQSNRNVRIANNLLNTFGSKYVYSKDNKLLFEEFLQKYEIIANEYIVEGKTTNQDMVFSVEEIEKAAK